MIDCALPDSPVLSKENIAGDMHAALSFARPTAADDINHVVRILSDMKSWSDAARFGPEGDSITSSIATQVSRATVNGVETIKLSLRKTVEETPAQFRVKIKP